MNVSEEKSKILIVEDASVSVYFIKNALGDHYVIRVTQSGEEALELTETFNPDLILLDVTLPGIDGFEVCRKISKDEKYADIPIIMVTASDDAEYVRTGIEAGAIDYVPKPFSEIELKARVESALKLRHYILMLKRANKEKAALIVKLETALSEIKTLSGLLPICSNCKKVRDDKGYWNEVETYLTKHVEVEFTHGICPGCRKQLYPEYTP